MTSRLIFYVILAALLSAATWGLMRAQNGASTTSSINVVAAASEPKTLTSFKLSTPNKTSLNQQIASSDQPSPHRRQIEQQLNDGHFQSAANYINEHYSAFSSVELEELKLLFLQGSAQSESRIDRLRAATRVFDDLESWDALAEAALELREWQTGFKALMRASELENSSPALEEKLESLVKVSSHLRASLEKRGDELGIKDLYQSAYDLHPNYARFQLELANAHLRLGEYDKAERLLSALQYDPEFGEIAQQALARAQDNQTSSAPAEQPPTSAMRNNDIVVPLRRAGNSFFVDTSINNRRTRLLLDTGASITALSSELIERLKLRPTGQVIQLSTANGARSARLFKTDNLTLGRIQLSGLVIAEIGLEGNAGFEGLLGTDALNQIDSDYSYLIDNNENALIFRRR